MSSNCCGVVTSLPCAAAWLAIDSKVGLFASPWLGKLRMFRLFWLYAGLLFSLSTGWCWCFWYVFLYGWKRLGSCLTVLIVVGITPGAPFPVTTSRTWNFVLNIYHGAPYTIARCQKEAMSTKGMNELQLTAHLSCLCPSFCLCLS